MPPLMHDFTPHTLPTPESRRPLIPVEVPTLGGRLYLRRLSAGQVTTLPQDQLLATGLAQSVVFADGTPVWATKEDVMAYPIEDVQPLLDAFLAANGMTVEAATEPQPDRGA